jgi:hypothetical protein
MTDEHQDGDQHIEPIDPDLARLLKSGAPSLIAPAGASERLLGKLAISIPSLGHGPGGGGGGGGGGGAVATAAAPAATKAIALVAAVIAIGGAVAGIAVSSRSADSKINAVTTIAPLGSSAPASASAIPTSSSDVPTVSIDSLPTAATAKEEKRSAPHASSSASASSSPSPSPSPSGAASAPTAGDVVEERRLVDGARAALARGDAAGAMTGIEEHEKRFASGVLVEEREAIAIRALVAQRRTTEAEARAARFRTRHPTSLFLPSVEAAMGTKDR